MKRLLLALTIVALLVPTARQATAADVSVDFFYNNLSGGNWIEVGDYGYGWQPDITVSDPNWRPYSDGYWAYTDVGWTWVSYEDFGWATYHYGRWSRVADYGWVWFPGNDLEWGPAWVSWRTGGDYIGWAPLPPRGPGIAYAGVSIGGQVDVEFDIGPAYYNFVDVRYIGEPVLRDRIFAPSQNVTYINQTVNVTNITYNNNTVYNYGPDYSALSARSSRPIQRLNIERQQNVDLSTAAKSGALTKVQGDKLVVAAPNKLQKSAKLIAPPSVKAKVAQPKIEHGWSGISNEAELKQKMKTENPKNIPPPTGAAATGRTPGGASPAAAAVASAAPAPATSVTPFERGKGRGRPGGQVQPSLTGTPAGSPAGAGSPAIQGSPAGRERGKPPGGRRGELPASPSGQTGAASVAPEGTQPPSKHKGQLERGNLTPTPGQPGGASNQPPPGKPKVADTKAHRPEHNLQQQRPLLLILRADLAVPRKPKVADTKAHRPEHNLQQQRPLLILRADLAVRRKPKAADKKAHPPERNLPLRLLNAARADLERQGDREAEKRRAKPLRLQLRNRRQFDHASAPGLIWS